MVGRESLDSGLESAAEAAGAGTTEAFKLLSNETRLAILLALWEAADPGLGNDELSFTELRDRVGVRQGGRFNYHLDKLVGRFVERTDGGYALRTRGETLVRTVIGAAGFDAPSIDRTEIEMPCRHCGGRTAVTYEDEWLHRVCTECEGTFENDAIPDGCLSGFPLAPAAVTDRTPEELFAVAKYRALQAVHDKVEGICPSCSGPVNSEPAVCVDHDDDSICETCGRSDPVRVRLACEVCKDWSVVPVATCLMFHPAVVAFYYDHDISLQWNIDDFATLRRVHDLIVEEVELDAADPSRLLLTFRIDGDELRLTLDRELDVVKVDETG
jgi:hypothetical protein